MAKNKKRADGYLTKTFTFNNKRYYVYAKDRKELERKAFEKLHKLESGEIDHENPTLDKYHETWTKNRRNSIKEATLRCQHFQYQSCADVLIGDKRLGDFRLSEIRPDDIRTVQRTLLEKNSTQTINDKIAVLNHMFIDAVKERYIDYNPVLVVKNLKRTEKKARDTIHRALTIEETQRFFEYAQKSNYYDVFRMCILTGMRIGEVGALFQSDIYDNAIHVNRTITKTESGSYVIGEDTKTWSGRRIIPLNDSIKEVIEHQKSVNRIDEEKVIGLHEPIFKAPQRGLLMSTPCDRQIAAICKRAGIEKFTAHAFRATFATRAIEKGIAVRTIQELLGHKDYSITMNLYGHVVNSTLESAMNEIGIAL